MNFKKLLNLKNIFKSEKLKSEERYLSLLKLDTIRYREEKKSWLEDSWINAVLENSIIDKKEKGLISHYLYLLLNDIYSFSQDIKDPSSTPSVYTGFVKKLISYLVLIYDMGARQATATNKKGLSNKEIKRGSKDGGKKARGSVSKSRGSGKKRSSDGETTYKKARGSSKKDRGSV